MAGNAPASDRGLPARCLGLLEKSFILQGDVNRYSPVILRVGQQGPGKRAMESSEWFISPNLCMHATGLGSFFSTRRKGLLYMCQSGRDVRNAYWTCIAVQWNRCDVYCAAVLWHFYEQRQFRLEGR